MGSRGGMERHTAPQREWNHFSRICQAAWGPSISMLILSLTFNSPNLRNFFKPKAYECLTLEKRDNGICQSHVSFAASNEMGDGGRGRPPVHLLRSVQFRQQQPVPRRHRRLRSWSWALGRRLGWGLCGPLWLCVGSGGASLQLSLELGKLLGTGQCLQQIVLLLQLGIFLY